MAWGGGSAGQSSGGWRPGGRQRCLEVSGDSVNQFEGFSEEGAHRGSSSMMALSGGGDLVVVGWRSSWWWQRRGQGGALYSCGGHCGDGGACEWPKAALNSKAASAGEEEEGQIDASMIPYRGRRLRVVASLAWL
jgi:hypothetical protein